MTKLGHKFKHLTIIRLFIGLLTILTVIGRWEHNLLFKNSRRRSNSNWNWLIRIGYFSETIVLAVLMVPKFIFNYLKLSVLAVGRFTRLIIKLIFKPWFLLGGLLKRGHTAGSNFILKIRDLVLTSPKQTKILSDRAKSAVKKLKPKPKLNFLRPVGAFACLMAILILPLKFYGNWQALASLKEQVVGSAKAALNEAFTAKQAVEQKDFEEANRRFSQAGANFLEADKELKKVNGFLLTLAGLLPNAQARLASNSETILEAGNLGSGIAADLTMAMDSLFGQKQGDLVTALAGFTEHGGEAKAKADQLAKALAKIDEASLPEEYQADFSYFKSRVDFLSVNLGELVEMSAKLRLFLGEAYDKRYLLVFQNNTEARATGGFMGSFAIVDFSRGKIKSLEVPGGGTYDTEAGMSRMIEAPYPMQLVRARWYMWDANWWPDWPTSARKVMWFYEQSGGSTVDGVISLTPEIIIRLLDIVGPVDLAGDFNVRISGDNFMDVVQSFAEQKYGETNKPKQIIGSLMDELIARISAEQDQALWLKIIGVIEKSLNEKQLLLYFSDNELESKVAELGWDGRLKETSGDYLSVVNTNINGGKSDKVIKQTVELTTNVLSDGSLVNHLKIIRHHQGKVGEEFSGVRNFDWLRVYVPLGSQLIEAEGFKAPNKLSFEVPEAGWELGDDLLNEREAEVDEPSGTKIYREQDKTVFANWSIVDPGEMTVIKLSYKLPFKLESRPTTKNWLDRIKDVFAQNTDKQLYRHSLLVQKQSGSTNSEVNYKFEIPSFYEQVWHYGDVSSADYLSQDTDKYWGYILQDKTINYEQK